MVDRQMEGGEGCLRHISIPRVDRWQQQVSGQGENILSTPHLFLYQGLFNILDSHMLAARGGHFVD